MSWRYLRTLSGVGNIYVVVLFLYLCFFLLHVFIVVRCRVSRENKVAQEKLLNPETCPLDRTGRRAVRQSTVRAVM